MRGRIYTVVSAIITTLGLATPASAQSAPRLGRSPEIAYNFGGGVKYPLNDRLILRADLRRFQSTDLSPDFWRLMAE
jgi:hypothetical protein